MLWKRSVRLGDPMILKQAEADVASYEAAPKHNGLRLEAPALPLDDLERLDVAARLQQEHVGVLQVAEQDAADATEGLAEGADDDRHTRADVVLLEDLLRHLVADLILEGVLERHGLL